MQIIFHFLWDHWAYPGVFENVVLFMDTLEGVSSVANFSTAYEESQKPRLPYSICNVFFFQRYSFMCLIYFTRANVCAVVRP